MKRTVTEIVLERGFRPRGSAGCKAGWVSSFRKEKGERKRAREEQEVAGDSALGTQSDSQAPCAPDGPVPLNFKSITCEVGIIIHNTAGSSRNLHLPIIKPRYKRRGRNTDDLLGCTPLIFCRSWELSLDSYTLLM